MDLSTVIGLVVGFGALLASVLMEGGDPAAFLSISAMLLVFGGTIGATTIAFPMEVIISLPKLIGITMKKQDYDPHAVIETFVGYAEKARKNGLLSLEGDVQQINDEFFKQGLLLAIDGTEAEALHAILENQLETMMERHEEGYAALEAMGGFSPTMGIIGTVMGLVHVLSNLSAPSTLGPKIAVAFIATLWGVMSANLIWLPLGSKLKRKNAAEVFYRTLIITGILALLSGENPRLVRQKLEGMIRNDPQKKGAEAADESKAA